SDRVSKLSLYFFILPCYFSTSPYATFERVCRSEGGSTAESQCYLAGLPEFFLRLLRGRIRYFAASLSRSTKSSAASLSLPEADFPNVITSTCEPSLF